MSKEMNMLLLNSVLVRPGITKYDGKCKQALLKFYYLKKDSTIIIGQRLVIFSVNTKFKR